MDISHAREAMDWTRYISMRLAASPMRASARTATFRFENLQVTVRMPAEADDDERIEIAAATTYRLLAWHEVSTWFGYSLVPFVSERGSAFTPDDLTGHAIGVRVAKDVLQHSCDLGEYERSAGAALEEAVAALEPITPQHAHALCRQLEGVWWEGMDCRVADTQMGLAKGIKCPLLVSDYSGEPIVGEGIVWSQMSPPLYRFVVSGSVSRFVEDTLGTREITTDAQLQRQAKCVQQELTMIRAYAWDDTGLPAVESLATR